MKVASVHGKGNATIFAVTSKFKQKDATAPWTVIVTLGSHSNGFYDKHVLREGESSRDVWEERKSLMPNAGFDATQAASAVGKGIFTGSSRSTFIRLKAIGVKSMVYGLAKSLLENYLAGEWPVAGSYNAHLAKDAVFDQDGCVVSYDGQGSKSYARSIRLGGKLVAVSGRELTFDLDHCGGSGAT